MDWADLGRIIQPWATIGGMTIAACSLFVASLSLRVTSKTNKAKFVFDITESFLKEPNLKAFWYKLDYDRDDERSWRFDLETFRHSDDERIIDTILYKFVVIGHMIKSKVIVPDDVSGLYLICRQFFHNYHIREYLRYVQIDFYCSDGFTQLQFENGLYCYERMTSAAVARRRVSRAELSDCRAFISELKALSSAPDLRKEIAARIGYTLRTPPTRRSLWALLTSSRRTKD